MTMIERERVAADWAERGFGCELWTDPPGARWGGFHARDRRTGGRA